MVYYRINMYKTKLSYFDTGYCVCVLLSDMGQFNSGIKIDGKFQFLNKNCLFKNN